MPSPVEAWHALLRPEVELAEPFWRDLVGRLEGAKLTFGGRVTCPFLRPCFIDRAESARVARVGETMWRVGERVAQLALERPDLLATFRLNEAEERLARLEPGYATASTASRLDAFLLPTSLMFAEYNAESPAGLGYSQTLGEVFLDLPITKRFAEQYEVEQAPLVERILEALLASYAEWGGTASPPTVLITDWRDVPTWNEFEIIQARFERQGVPTIVADPRDLVFERGALWAAGRRIDLVYRRVLINDIVARPEETRALVDAYRARAVCVANTFRCKIPHKKTFFAVLTDERFAHLFDAGEHAVIRAHVPWTRLVDDVATTKDGRRIELLAHVREHKDGFVMKPADEYGGSGVTLGWETPAGDWDATIETALAEPARAWIVQERIPIRREMFPWVRQAALPSAGAPEGASTTAATATFGVEFKDVLVDFAPYLFRGKLAGYLTRLSSTGLANVTSGGGQVPVLEIALRA